MRRFLVRLGCPWVFRSAKAQARHLRGLAATEQGSYFSLQWAAQGSASIQRQALYLRHAADEARHAQLFYGRAAELVPPPGPLLADAEDLFDALGELQFLAFVHHAEKRGRQQFEIYAEYFRNKGRERDRALFERVSADEQHHERYSFELLVELAGSGATARKQLRKVQLWEAWRTWKRSGRVTARALYALLIWALFPLLLPYALITRLLVAEKAGFRSASLPPAAPARDRGDRAQQSGLNG